jgi:predicted Zn finger-like uncharacterized protein
VKFLCDRCKTRYSIGDDRVRGKILKIRCKNCANVITVREGMLDADAAEAALPAEQRRPKQQTTVAPKVQSETPAPAAPAVPARNGALGAAFASAMTKPPPALDEEWYVSIDGEQAGPFSLAEAQRWVGAKSYDADLHCWSEGFDDWLPVDKVSHFRGLRKKPAPAPAPPPLPRVGGGLPRAAMARTAPAPMPTAMEETPKPLFAATMASLEKATASPAATSVEARGHLSPNPTSPLAPAVRPSPATPLAPATRPSNNGATLGTPSGGSALPVAARGTNGASAKTVRGKSRPLFDVADPAESNTEIESPPFAEESATAAEPAAAAARRAAHHDAFAAKAHDAAVTMPRMPPKPSADEDIDGDGELDIGEVSRVVNLADIARSSRPRGDRAAPVGRRSGSIPTNQTGSLNRVSGPRIGGGTAPAAAIPGGPEAVAESAPVELAPAAVHVSHRRGMIALVVGATLLLGAAIAVVFVVTSDNDSGLSGLGRVDEFDTSRPDDPRRRGSAGDPTPEQPANPFVPQRRITKQAPKQELPVPQPLPTGNSLKAEEIEEMAGKYSSTTQRCYMRSQRGVDAILIGDVKKIAITLTISGDGSVSDVQLSDNHAANSLGKCIIGSIRGWRFRASPGGTFKFVLHFG